MGHSVDVRRLFSENCCQTGVKCVNYVERRKMSSVSSLVLVILVTFFHCSFAIRCYYCISDFGDYCDDPLDKDNPAVEMTNCTGSCKSGRGTAKSSKNLF